MSNWCTSKLKVISSYKPTWCCVAEIRMRKALVSPRTRLLQRFAVFPEGMRFLVDLRQELMPALKSNKRLLALEAPERALIASGLVDAAQRRGWSVDAVVSLERVVAAFPNDPGVLVSVLLDHDVLRPGEAIAVSAGIVHSYVGGLGVEVMTSSDNVLRGGLTGGRRNPAPVRIAKNLGQLGAAFWSLDEIKGGFVVVEDGKVTGEIPLPVAGLMSLEPYESVRDTLHHLRKAAYALGTTLEEPFLQVAFLPLPVIPHLKISDKGMVDVDQFRLIG